tara:strand:- start:7277 stop:7462 length:186 start_codon:yes stop_codon:yes gene_type:complete
MIKLNSVGSFIDKNTGMVYPINKDGSIDIDNGVHYKDCGDEWLESISDSDWDKIKKLPNIN